MTYDKFIKCSVFSLVSIFLSTNVYAQFDKKVTFNVGGGAFLPLGTKQDADSQPYVFPNFKNGYQVMVGGQYNLNPNFSIGLNFLTSIAVNYKNPIPQGGKSSIIEQEEKGYSSYFTNFGLGLDLKYKILPTYKLNPFVFIEINGNYYYGEVQPRLQFYEQERLTDDSYNGTNVIRDKYTILRYNAQIISPALAFGVRAGVGVDYRISDSFTIFIQGGYATVFSQSNAAIRTSLDMLAAQAGIRFSVFKSKSIL